MQVWQKVLLYAIIMACYIALHEVFFRARFKIMLFTLVYAICASIVLIIAFRFDETFVWVLIVNVLFFVIYFAYAVMFLRTLRKKLSQQVSEGKSLDEILKTMSGMLGGNQKPDELGREEDSEYGEIKAEEVEDEQTEEKEKKNFDVGDIIIDEKSKDKDNKDN